MNCELIILDSILVTFSAAQFTSILHAMISITERILPIIIGKTIALLIYIRIPKSKRNAQMQIKKLHFIEMVFFIVSIKPLEYTACIQ